MDRPKFALIYEEEVMNIFDCDNYEIANQMARAAFGDDAFAVNTERFGTVIGDKYKNGYFVKEIVTEDGTIEYEDVIYIPSEKEHITELQYKLIKSQEAQITVFEEKMELENKVLLLQELITKLYENTEV